MEEHMKKIISLFLTAAAVAFALSAVRCAVSAQTAMPDVSAKACVLIEEKTGRIVFEKDSSVKLPMASTTKIMTTLLCLESGGLDDEFVVDKDAIRVEGSSMGLKEGDVVTKRMLCYGMLLPSGNDAANAAAVRISGSIEKFAEKMNERAAEIGMTHTNFVTPSGLEGEGHGASAYDMALLAREALKNPDFAEICCQSRAQVHFGNPPFDRWLKNTNKLLTMYDGIKGVKTGFTDEAGRCLVSACERGGISLICVTLNDRDDWNDHMHMYDSGFEKVKKETLKSGKVLDIPVVGGVSDSVKVSADESVDIGVFGDSTEHITSKVIVPPFVYADVSKGDRIGALEWYYDKRLVGEVPIKARESVKYKHTDGSPTLWERIKGFLFN